MPVWVLTALKLPIAPLAALWRWLGEDARHMALAALLMAAGWCGWQWHRVAADRDAQAAAAVKWQANAKAWEAAHAKLVADVQAARVAAEAADRANAARAAREFDQIRERTADAYEKQLDDTSAALDRLRRDLAKATAGNPGDGAGARVPAALAARCRAFGAADCDALLAALPDVLAAAEENTGKLIALQDWARSVLAVDVSGVDVSGADVPGEGPSQ
ncbi:MAG: hypothetical protein ACOY45_05845 [Pseudomonadota bacterium]